MHATLHRAAQSARDADIMQAPRRSVQPGCTGVLLTGSPDAAFQVRCCL